MLHSLFGSYDKDEYDYSSPRSTRASYPERVKDVESRSQLKIVVPTRVPH